MEKANAEDDKAQILVDQYKDKRYLFEEYTKTIHLLLEHLLRQHKSQFQTVQSRPKELSHLREKLLRKKELQNKPLLEMSDLAACRVIFYFEEDLDQFAETLYDEFDIVDDENKVTPNEYNARQVVLKLKENRFNLPEYVKFKGLLCEVQLTTVLFHAWSEIQHDIIYKPNKELLDFDKPTFDYIDSYFREIMEKYLKEASRGFSFINYQFNRIKNGQAIISPNIIDVMSRSTSNNDIYAFLKLLSEYIPKYADKLPQDYRLIDALELTLNSAEKNAVVDRKTIFGNLKGITYTDIANVILDMLGRYYDVANNLRLIIKLGKRKELQKRCEDSLNRMVSYRIGVVKQYGFAVQKITLDYISNQKPDYLLDNFDMVLAALKPLASLECEDFTMDEPYKVTFKRGYLKPNSHLQSIRMQYFELTKSLLTLVKTDTEKKKTINLMFSLAYNIHNESVSSEIIALLSQDTARIVNFLIEFYDSAPDTIKSDIEQFIFHIERQKLTKSQINLQIIKEKIEHDSEYNKFKIFYGNDVEFFADYNFEEAQKYRNQKIDDFVNQIEEANFKEWLSLLRELAAICQEVIGYTYLSIFLRKLSKNKPNIAFELMKDKQFSSFLGDLLSGLIESAEQDKARELLIHYSSQETKQLAVIRALLSKKGYDDNLFQEIYPSMLKSTDNAVLLMLLQTITLYYNNHKNHKDKVTEIINKFTALQFYSWSYVYYSSKQYWQEMNDENVTAILENLVNCNTIGYEEESILGCIALKNPKAVIRFFYNRVQLAKTKKISEPLPFQFSTLNETLSMKPAEILPEITKWLSDKHQIENWYATKLIEIIFPSFGSDMEPFVLELIHSNDVKTLEMALQILRRYEGEPSIHKAIKEIIKLYSLDKDLKITLFRLLSGIKGVVGGEYGFLDA